jgi:hypothetical protein
VKTLAPTQLIKNLTTGESRKFQLAGCCDNEIKPRITMAKAALKKKKTLFTSKLYLNLRGENF